MRLRRVLKISSAYKSVNKVTQDAVNYQQQANSLLSRISSWRQVQALYMPGIYMIIKAAETEPVPESQTEAVNVKLYLPSALPSKIHRNTCLPGLEEKERLLRLGQADDSLSYLRDLLRSFVGLTTHRMLHVSGQRPITRMQNILNRFNEKIQVCAERYRAARNALIALDPNGDWQKKYQPLLSTDIRGPGQMEHEITHYGQVVDKTKNPRLGEGRRELSWIWKNFKNSADDMYDTSEYYVTLHYLSKQQYCEGLRVEYAKSKARVERWSEEVDLLVEEMRRTLVYLEYKSEWWKKQQPLTTLDLEIRLGSLAYCFRQSHQLNLLSDHFHGQWSKLLACNHIVIPWNVDGRQVYDISNSVLKKTGDVGDEDVEYDVEYTTGHLVVDDDVED
jgi:hypothetical protein